MKTSYISPEAIKIIFEVKDIISASGDAFAEGVGSTFQDLVSISWDNIINK